MSAEHVIDIGTSAIFVCLKLAGPFLVVVLAIGVIVGLVQSVTQLQEQTLSFVPKLAGAALVIVLAGNWMLAEMVAFARELIATVPDIIGG